MLLILILVSSFWWVFTRINRYDGRGALSDLQAHEAITQWDNNEGLTDEEKRAEQLCDEERYRSLYERNDEEELRKGIDVTELFKI